MKDLVINGLNLSEAETERYWAFPKNKGSKAEIKNMIFSLDYLGSQKMDGYYYRFIKNLEGEMTLQSRSRGVSGSFTKKIGHVPHLHSFFNELPNGTCLLGEVYFPHKEGSKNVTTIMGCGEAKAISRQEKDEDKLHYYVFDIWAYDGVSYMETAAEERFKKVSDLSTDNPFVQFAQYYEGKELWDEMNRVLYEGGEGIVITKRDTTPAPGKRTARKTLKIKKELEETIDCFFTGRVTPPNYSYEGKYLETWTYWANPITEEKFNGELYKDYFDGEPIEPITKAAYYDYPGSLEVGVIKGNKVVPIGFLSGLTEEIKANYKKYKGRVIEVMAMEIDKETGGLRHAKMIRFRDDLTIQDCTYEKIFGAD